MCFGREDATWVPIFSGRPEMWLFRLDCRRLQMETIRFGDAQIVHVELFAPSDAYNKQVSRFGNSDNKGEKRFPRKVVLAAFSLSFGLNEFPSWFLLRWSDWRAENFHVWLVPVGRFSWRWQSLSSSECTWSKQALSANKKYANHWLASVQSSQAALWISIPCANTARASGGLNGEMSIIHRAKQRFQMKGRMWAADKWNGKKPRRPAFWHEKNNKKAANSGRLIEI